MNLNEKAAYLKGLFEGMELDTSTKEGKLLAALVDFCGEVAESVAAVEEKADHANEYCEELDEDLGAVEELLVDDDDDDWFDDDDFDDEDDEEEWDDEAFYEMDCPHCGATIEFDAGIDPEHLTCPACHKAVAVSVEDLEALDGSDEG